MEIGYSLASEEFHPQDMLRWAAMAERSGFRSAWISDHFHPWTRRQGQSPFVWSVIGGLAATTQLRVGTAVTCPLIRMHPAIVAHAAATCGAMMPGRFSLGVGTGENLNEHVLGDKWPPLTERLEMLEEAVGLIRRLWDGRAHSVQGRHYRVEQAQLYTLPDEPVPIVVSGFGKRATELAGRIGDGYMTTAPDRELVQTFERAGGAGKPKVAGIKVCWDSDEAKARRLVHDLWPNLGLPGQLGQELATPAHFEQAVELVDEDTAVESVVCGPDPERHLDVIRSYVAAGFDELFVHQIGSEQEGFLDFYRREVLPKV